MPAQYVIALDVGGTFTDVTLVEPSMGRLWSLKTPSTLDDASVGFAEAVRQALAQAAIDGGALGRVFHATTTATNAILEGKGVKTGLITTEGFKYVLEIGRHDMPRRSNKYLWLKPPRPVPPERVLEVAERLDPSGAVEVPLDVARCREIAARLRADGVESVAICFLYSYVNAVHERRAAGLVREVFPEVALSLSVDVLPLFREYERSMATVLNAYVMPLVSRYIGRVRARLAELGVDAPFHVMKSNGGPVSPEVVAVQPVCTALSGPAAAVVGATRLARAAGYDDIISIDVGGTSADVCLVQAGAPETTEEGQVGPWPLHLPMLNIHTIGAGGGSIARVSAEGVFTVGPESAGASPGPVCYGQGGREPTVTDAHLVLGHIPPHLLGGAVPLDTEAARAAIAERVAGPLGLDVDAAASGILELVNNSMMGAIRVVSIERGQDPRDYVLLAGGGAGPLHAADLADLLAMPEVLVPPRPGVLSTFGLLFSDLRNDFVRTYLQPLATAAPDDVAAAFAELEARAAAWLDQEGVSETARAYEWFATLRYVNQIYELELQWPLRAVSADVLQQLTRAFHERHQQLYTYCSPDAPVELVTLRVLAVGTLPKLEVPRAAISAAGPPVPIGQRAVYFRRERGFEPTAVYARDQLGAGAAFDGPAVVEQMDTTALVPPGWTCRVDEFGNLILKRGG